ncbi:MAG: hypothetical protein NZ516_11260 [Raineya sp.]|nr:hypothetical protein [Raineya sp.]
MCRDCGKQFQSHYKYAGANPTIKPLNPYAIKEFRDTRLQIVLGVSRYTVLRTLLVVAEKTLIEPKREHHHSFNR